MNLQISYPPEMREQIRDDREYGFWIEATADIQIQNEQTETTEQPDISNEN